jgi:hypothetical protein
VRHRENFTDLNPASFGIAPSLIFYVADLGREAISRAQLKPLFAGNGINGPPGNWKRSTTAVYGSIHILSVKV